MIIDECAVPVTGNTTKPVEQKYMQHLSLFAGIGGCDLAAHAVGFKTVAFCEKDKFCQRVLAKHWPGVTIYDDIFELSADALVARGINPGQIKLISGGFPCQPYSNAGKRLGAKDDRALWPQMFRVIQDVHPDWILGENVSGIISMALDGVLSDLESANYETGVFVLPACSVNAPHRRDRVFIVAHARSIGRWNGGDNQQGRYIQAEQDGNPQENQSEGDGREYRPGTIGETGSDTTGQGLEGSARSLQEGGVAGLASVSAVLTSDELGYGLRGRTIDASGSTESGLGGTAHGTTSGLDGHLGFDPNPWDGDWERGIPRTANSVPKRVDRLRALGNAIVPQQVWPILKAIADWEALSSEQKAAFK